MGGLDKIFETIRKFFKWKQADEIPFHDLFVSFQQIIQRNNAAMEIIADMGSKTSGEFLFDKKYLVDSVNQLKENVRQNAYTLNFMAHNQYLAIIDVVEELTKELETNLSGKIVIRDRKIIYFLDEIEEHMQDVVGPKAFNLSRIMKDTEANVPKGFVVTVSAFRNYMAYNNLFERIAELIADFQEEKITVEPLSDALRLMILGGDLLPEIRRGILAACKQIMASDREVHYYSIRSSGMAEGGDLSFAGLHDSFLNVPLGEVLSNYKKVLASLYNRAGLEYRRKHEFLPMEMAMAVLCQEIVDSRVAGVLYTVDPNHPDRPDCLLTAVWGLGNVVVEGHAAVDTYRVSRDPPYSIVEEKIARKDWMTAAFEMGGGNEVPPELQTESCLAAHEAAELVRVSLMLEKYFKQPLDVEWSLDQDGKLWILQARPMHIPRIKHHVSAKLPEVLKDYPVLLKDQGEIAYRGVGSGPVWKVEDKTDLSRVPNGAVLVSRFGPPWLAEAIPRASAVVTDIGSTTAHMATVARESRVPTLVGTGAATEVLVAGQEVTVDAIRNVIYEGCISELLHHHLLTKGTFENTYEFRSLRRLLRRIAPLTLTDPEAPNFNVNNCRTIHDIMRFIHEKAIGVLTQYGKNPRALIKQGGRRLKSDLPIDLMMIDIGGGFTENVGKGEYVDPDQIASFPMKALWEGLSSPEAWSTEPIDASFKDLMSSLSRTQAAEVLGHVIPGVNLAVIGADYVNLNLRLGYHISAVDAGLGSKIENNYIFFRFIGGVTDITQRSRRASLLMSILEQNGFKVQLNGDLVIARAIQLTEAQMNHHLCLLGKLLGFTRQLDVLLKSDADIDIFFEKFMNGIMLNTTNQKIKEDFI
jgi:pyruvate,water dikinase